VAVLQDLVNDLSSELSFRFKQTILALMMSPSEYDASELHKAIRVSLSLTLHLLMCLTFACTARYHIELCAQ
jgi:hypothetical protein